MASTLGNSRPGDGVPAGSARAAATAGTSATVTSATLTSTTGVRSREARIGAAAMIGSGLAWSRLPVHPPLACPMRTITGIPCPFCGMTRAVVAALHGHPIESLRFNPAGILVVMVAIALLAGVKLERLRVAPWVLGVGVALLWAWNVGFNPTFH